MRLVFFLPMPPLKMYAHTCTRIYVNIIYTCLYKYAYIYMKYVTFFLWCDVSILQLQLNENPNRVRE